MFLVMQPEGWDAEGPDQVGLEVSLLMLTPEEATAGRRQAATAQAPSSPARGEEVRPKAVHNTAPSIGGEQVSSVESVLWMPVLYLRMR